MPKDPSEMDALERLLVEKYGIDPDKAEAYALQIRQEPEIAGQSGKYLQQEAGTNIASGALENMRYLGNIPKMVNPAAVGTELPAVSEPPAGVPEGDLMRWWQQLQDSRENVRKSADWAKEIERMRMERTDQLLAPQLDMQVESVQPVQAIQAPPRPLSPDIAKERLRRAHQLRSAIFRGP